MRKLDRDILSGIFLVVLGAVGYHEASQITNMTVTRLSGAFFPCLLFAIIASCGVCLIFQGATRKQRRPLPSFKWKRLIGMVCLLLAYVFIMRYVGFIISTVLFLISSMLLFGERRLKVLIPVSLIAAYAVYELFTEAFMIILPGIPFLEM